MAKKENVMILKLIRSFFKSEEKPTLSKKMERKVLTEPDFIDYDGMGNQGRFPDVNRRKK